MNALDNILNRVSARSITEPHPTRDEMDKVFRGALQTAVVIFGIPFSIITAFACRELYRSLEDELNS